MKLLFTLILWVIAQESISQAETKFNDTAFLQPIEVTAIRAAENAPFAKSNITKKEIEKNNLGQDLPFLLNHTPSVVVNSDAGNGVGYTGIRIRGSDASRINVTLNGIPYNDAESQGTFFVDLPDIASSANSIQIQRGVGTSSNGAGSFGGNINISSNEINDKIYAEFNNSYGSYNTWKNTMKIGSGIIGKHFTIDARLSNLTSDGYIDRATSNLKSFYISTAFIDKKNSFRVNIFSGKEKTYQAWNGVPESYLKGNRTYNSAGLEQPGKPYDNETDNYIQTHYQFFYNHQFSSYWKANMAVFLTKGNGYYEQYKADAPLSNYGLNDYNSGNNIISKTDLVRRLWLDNNFYGTIYSVQHHKKGAQLTLGGGWNQYDGKHFGKIIKAKVQQAVPINYRWYDITAGKTDLSLYGKWMQRVTGHWQSFIDIQVRNVRYGINGFRDNPTLKVKNRYTFFNPKIGFTYLAKNWQAYFSYAKAGKEPNRDDYEAGNTNTPPKPEILNDFEFGVEKKGRSFSIVSNLYFMKYRNQLVLTGKINDVGAYTRTNILRSYRAGIELQAAILITKWLNVDANATFSENKIKDFTEYIDDYDNGGQVTNFYKKTNIAFSPALTAGGSFNFIPLKNGEISLQSKYVSRQYLDNTSQVNRSLNGYFVQDVRLSYLVENKIIKSTTLVLKLMNVFNKKYEANGYSFSYIYGGLITENFYFPMAPFNCMIGLNIKL